MPLRAVTGDPPRVSADTTEHHIFSYIVAVSLQRDAHSYSCASRPVTVLSGGLVGDWLLVPQQQGRIMAVRINSAHILAAEPGARLSDSDVVGLTYKVSKAGVASWTLRYRFEGQRREFRIGAASLTASQARTAARKKLHEIADGTDPLAAAAARKEAEAARKARVTVKAFRDTYQKHVQKKPLSKDSDDSIFDRWIIPLLGNVAIADVGREHAQKLHAHVTDAGFKIRANRAHALLSHLLTEAARRGLREAPLPRGVVIKNEENPRQRYLTPVESSRLWKALAAMQEPTKSGRPGVHTDSAQALQLLMLTGCRKREILNLRWAEVDAEASVLRLEDSKTGRRLVQLSPAALAILEARRPAEDSVATCVFPQADTDVPICDVKRAWAAATKAAKLTEVRCHDLRHTLASQAVAAGLSLVEVGKLLGHRSQQTSSRYAHLSDDAARLASDRVAERMTAITGGKLRAVS